MKRLIALAMTLVLLLSVLSACGNAPEAPVTNDTPVVEPDTPSNDANDVPDESPASSQTNSITSKEAFIETVESLVDVSLYDWSSSESDSSSNYSYYIKSENETNYDLDYSITLSDGSTFTLPISFAEMKELGWTLQESSQSDAQMDPGYMSWGYCENTSGQELYISAYNPGEEIISFGECSVCEVEFSLFDTFENPPEPYENTPGFTICGSITQDSTLEDIISVLGAPSSLDYFIYKDDSGNYKSSTIYVEYVQESSPYSNLEFEISGDGNYIMTMEYQHIPD